MEEKSLQESKQSQKLKMIIITSMVFSGAILLFWMEPLVGRLLTPHFGGAANVWLVCLMFFQAMLFFGYLYSHFLAKKIGPYHLLLLLAPIVNLPLSVQAEFNPHTPSWNVLLTLLKNAAVPFVVLSTTAVVAQSWLSRSSISKICEPYPLYSASNAGALIALIGYVFIAEPFLGLSYMTFTWTIGYVLYAILVALSWLILRPAKELKDESSDKKRGGNKPLSFDIYVRWFILSSFPSAFLLAVTNLFTLEIGSFPLAWIAPLALYLLSFILTFRTRGGVPQQVNRIWPEILLISLFSYFMGPKFFGVAIFGSLATFFAICYLSHGFLYELRPSENHLTSFYLIIALGGWAGGAFVAFLAPFIFLGLFEYPILIGLFAILFWERAPQSILSLRFKSPWILPAGRILLIIALVGLIARDVWISTMDMVVYRLRNFYGIYRVIDAPFAFEGVPTGIRKLAHGMTLHGAQLMKAQYRLTPITYYHQGGGIADVFETVESPRYIAVIGLGSGVTASFARKEDTITFYEIDPDNKELAYLWFSYWDECKGKIDFVAGDGRLSLKNKTKKEILYDLILIDAFSGDGIPTNLLTREALQIYLSRLSPQGLILFHVSNRYYELRPVLKSTALDLKLYGARNNPIKKENLKPYQNSTKCIVLTRDSKNLEPLVKKGWIAFGSQDGLTTASPWTDDYINILHPMIENLRIRWFDKS